MQWKELFAKRFPYACLYFDASWFDMVMLYRYLAFAPSEEQFEECKTRLMQRFDPQHRQVIVTLCVRSAFDMYLSLKKFPRGSEVLMTAINIPDMVDIVRHHGLIPVPLDVSVDTLLPTPTELRKRSNANTVAVLVAHIYGKRSDISSLLQVTEELQLPLIEDLAEAFDGSYYGNPKSALALFSFGSIKVCTAFGGGVCRVREPALHDKMQALHEDRPRRSRFEMFKKLLKYTIVMMVLNNAWGLWLAIALLRAFGIDHKEAAVGLLRGFPDRSTFYTMIRRQPSKSLVAFLDYRLSRFHPSDVALNTARCSYFISLCSDIQLTYPGNKAEAHNFWLFPLLVSEPELFVEDAAPLGIDIYRGATQLRLIHPDSAKYAYPKQAGELMDHVVYLPIHKRVPKRGIDQMMCVLKPLLDKYHFVHAK